MRRSHRQRLVATCADLGVEPKARVSQDAPGEITLHLRPIGEGLVGHRQGHRVREQIGLRITLSQDEILPQETFLRAEFFDLPTHLYAKDGTVGFGSRLELSLLDLVAETFDAEISAGYYPLDHDRLIPDQEKPGVMIFEAMLDADIFALLLENQFRQA